MFLAKGSTFDEKDKNNPNNKFQISSEKLNGTPKNNAILICGRFLVYALP